MHSGLIALVAIAYLLLLFAVAHWADKGAGRWAPQASRPAVYSLSLAVYCTSWTFLGSVGVAAREGFAFLAIYLGPIVVFMLAPSLIERIVRHAKAEKITTVADFIGSRYGKSPAVAALATGIALVGTVPYISLQLKAISTSVATLVFHYRPNLDVPPLLGDLALPIATVLGLFAILFGTRHADATEHQDGLVLAVAMESLVKLAAFVAVGIWTTFYLFDPAELWRAARASTTVADAFSTPVGGAFFTSLGLSALVILLLPRQFHIAVVENRTRGEIRRARWLFPLYLIAINLFVVPIAAAGLLRLGPQFDADLYVLALPLSSGADLLGVVAFIGGLSAATAMVIVASVALAIMISNDLVLPILLKRRGRWPSRTGDETRLILYVRRSAILLIVFFGYLYYRFGGDGGGLASIGLLSFAAIAQLAPALFVGLYWKRANARGATIGMSVGIAVWAVTLLAPALGIVVPLVGPAVRPYADPLLLGVFLSLSANLAGLIAGSLSRASSPIERIQAALFADRDASQATAGRRMRIDVAVSELKATIARYLGAQRTERAFAAFATERDIRLDDAAPADSATTTFSEQLLASAIGSASSRLVLSLLYQRHTDSSRKALQLLDDASEALQYNRDLLRIALDQVDQGLAIFDGDFCLTFWNRQFRDLLGLPPEFGKVGTPLTVVFDHLLDDGEINEAEYKASFDDLTKAPAQRQIALKRSGRTIEMRVNTMPDGGLVATVSDMTERVRRAAMLREVNESLEERVRRRTVELTAANRDLAEARRAAEAANLGKTRFLAAAGHDILQPLNAARLYTSALEQRHGQSPGAELVGNIGSSLEAVEAIIGAVLDISRLDAGGMEAKPSDFPLAPLLRQIETDLRPLAEEKHLSLRFVATGVTVRSDRNLLRRLLQNLVSNAVKYTREGKIVVGVRRRGNGRIAIEVTDSGIGIPNDKLHAIYEEFVRLDEGSRAASGLGLGLSIVDRIARVLDHPISAHSRHGRGTSFRVELPLAAAGVDHQAPQSSPRSQFGLAVAGSPILCIDNDPAIRDGMALLLSGWHCDVETFNSAAEAIEACAATGFRPRLALVDYHLDGGSDGLQAIAELRHRLDAELDAILVTAERSAQVREQAAAIHVQVLTKPLKPASLRAAMASVLQRRDAAE
ncbi:hybrid sensor histidine kinase/response regulator [Jiella sp. MQZ9-1]|uniref:histidine kinase n=1 Tax=Jiella flava TaxID=2816857 RepID=A0A939JXF1_9HYPH|nr:PAS domain-containing hybrid sensor histidine kinase/response regulator [Jiella flava]MBO0664534.1 hybrid sensor histidine kinase/response regulator [Jiella flava]MCD2473168.1 hybrid sensor histidine kinase/response regulator [Jiella flava]